MEWKSSFGIVFLCLSILSFSNNIINCHDFSTQNTTGYSFSPCRDHKNLVIEFNNSMVKMNHDKYMVNGEFTFAKPVAAPIEVFELTF